MTQLKLSEASKNKRRKQNVRRNLFFCFRQIRADKEIVTESQLGPGMPEQQ